MSIKYVVIFQRCKDEDPPFPSKVIDEFKTYWITKHGNFRKEVCAKKTHSSKKAAVEASKDYKKTLEKRESRI